jgi:mycofactocin precursor peptide peptidase
MSAASRPSAGNTASGNTASGNITSGNRASGETASGDSSFTLATARWPDVEAGPRRLLVVPVGSLEQHGPHLPLDTDTRIAVAVAARACAGRAGVGIAPPIAIGASGEHADFPGTLSIGTEALKLVLVELGRHASLHWPAMLLVNGHGGNIPAINDALKLLRAEGRQCHAWHSGVRSAPPADTQTDPAAVHTDPADAHAGRVETSVMPADAHAGRVETSVMPADAHAGRVETSVMLALAPHDVRLDLAAPGDTRPLAVIMPALRAHGTRHVSPNGVLGDPTGASAAEGERLLAQLAAALDETLTALLTTPADLPASRVTGVPSSRATGPRPSASAALLAVIWSAGSPLCIAERLCIAGRGTFRAYRS